MSFPLFIVIDFCTATTNKLEGRITHNMSKTTGIGLLLFACLAGYMMHFDERLPQQIPSTWKTASETNLSRPLRDWEARGRYIEVQGRKMYVQDIRTSAPGNETLMILHGFPTSSFDFRDAVQGGNLDRQFTHLATDQLGYGLSEKPANYSYSIFEQADAALLVGFDNTSSDSWKVWKALGVKEAHLLAHDMSCSIATEILSRRDKDLLPVWAPKIKSITFGDAGMHIEYSNFRMCQILLRVPIVARLLSSFQCKSCFKSQILSTSTSPKTVQDEDMELWYELGNHNDGAKRRPQIVSYLGDRYRTQGTWIQALTRLDIPAHVLWGKYDTVAPTEIALQLAREIPNAKLTLLGLGHYPMNEDTKEWTNAALEFYKSIKK